LSHIHHIDNDSLRSAVQKHPSPSQNTKDALQAFLLSILINGLTKDSQRRIAEINSAQVEKREGYDAAPSIDAAIPLA
jgi:hypothetical protein